MSDNSAILIAFILWLKPILVLTFVVACQLITFVGLLGQLKIPDDPSYSSVQTNLLNPYLTWCPLVNGQPSSCYGTSWAHWGGPYSILWYWANTLLTVNGKLPYTVILFGFNLVIQTLLKTTRLAVPFSINCLFCLLGWPQNMIVLWLVFLGFYSKIGLVLAPVLKLPLGAPVYVWKIALGFTGTGLHDQGNWFVYLWLVAMWLWAFSVKMKVWSKITGKIPHQLEIVDEQEKEGNPDIMKKHDKGQCQVKSFEESGSEYDNMTIS